MRKILPYIIASITRHDREIVRAGVDFEWSDKSWTHNFFRALELIIGRRSGIRAEMSSWRVGGRTVYQCHSVEAVIALAETYIRAPFAKLSTIRVHIPVLATPLGMPLPVSPYLFAIAFDNATSAASAISTPNLSYSHTCTGSNLTLTTGIYTERVGAAAPTAVTYNSVPLSSKIAQTPVPNNVNSYNAIWVLTNPSTGSNTLSITGAASTVDVTSGCISLSGTNSTQTGASNSAGAATGTTQTVSVTTNTANSWLVSCIQGNDTVAHLAYAATSPATSRYTQNNAPGSGQSMAGSTRTTTTTGSYSIAWSTSVNCVWGLVALEIQPSVATANSGFFMAAAR